MTDVAHRARAAALPAAPAPTDLLRMDLLPRDLLNGPDELAALLEAALARGSSLDAFLFAAGLNQLVEDALHADPLELRRAASYLDSAGHAASARAARGAAGAGAALRRPGSRRLLGWQRAFAADVDALAGRAVGLTARHTQTEVLVTALAPLLPRLGDAPLRLPACFHAFDQRPEDVGRLVRRLARRVPDRRTPIVVAGVRTSGSYLAPLCAAYLRAEGYVDVATLTVRPGNPLLAHERRVLRRRGRIVAVIDDPPATGRSIARVAADLGRGQAILLLQLAEALPEALRGLDAIVVTQDEWSIDAALAPHAVRAELDRLLGPGEAVERIEPLELARAEPRGHRRALFRVRVADRRDGTSGTRLVLVEGVGLGYFGAAAAAIAAALGPRGPRVYGIADGLLYREWLSERPARDDPALAGAIAEYAVARRVLLPARRDAAALFSGEDAAWEAASTQLAQAFGHGWPLARRLALDRLVRRELLAERPSLVDGRTEASRWFRTDDGRLVKADGLTRRGPACYDALFDAAGAAPGDELGARVRAAFEQLSGETVDPARWLLYQLVHMHARRAPAEVRVRALQSFFAELFLRDVELDPTGPLCALDVDGVLETEVLGFPGLTPSSALALRALVAHGYRPVLVSGRTLDEVEERCRAYGLPGGVAEYGGGAYAGRRIALLPEGEGADLERLRVALRALPGVVVDSRYRYAVRAWRDPGRTPLPAGVAAAVPASSGASVRVVSGEAQTDFVSASVDKGVGLTRLAELLGAERIALAVGDTAADLPMLALAERPVAPSHAAGLAGIAGVRVVRRPYQAGLALAAAQLLGHRPGGCAACRAPRFSRGSELVLRALAARERGRAGMLRQALRLTVEAHR